MLGVHIAVDAVGNKHSGCALVLQDFLRAAVADAGISRLTVFSSPRGRRDFDFPDSEKLFEVPQPRADASSLARLVWLRAGLSRAVSSVGADALVSMSGVGTGPAGVRQVTLVQQSLPFSSEALLLGGIAERLRMAAIRLEIRRACRWSHRIVVQTPTMADWIRVACGPRLADVVVIQPSCPPLPEGTAECPEVRDMRSTTASPKILYVGSAAPHKNLRVAVSAVEALRRSLPAAELFGTWSWRDSLGNDVGVRRLGYLRRQALREAYGLASVLWMPSLVETVGLPLLEAMTMGVPIVVADRPYARDVCGDAATYFDPFRPDDLAARTRELLANPRMLAEQIARGRARVSRYSAAKPYLHLVEAVLDGSVPDARRS